MCIRALDYLPPVDVTFFEYLRALITADFDLVGDDRHNYRVAFVEAFRRRGIYPQNLDPTAAETPRTLSVDTLRWTGGDRSVEVHRRGAEGDQRALWRHHREPEGLRQRGHLHRGSRNAIQEDTRPAR